MVSVRDRDIVRKLASETAEIAALPVQEEKRKLWKKLNALAPDRPMVIIDQVPWNEVNVGGELTPQCEDPECRMYETHFKRILYQWKHFPADMVVDPFIRVGKAISNTGLGMEVVQDLAITDPESNIVGHAYKNQFVTDEDLDKIKMPVVTHDPNETARRMELADTLFGGIMPILEHGMDPYVSVWDPISEYMGVQEVLYTMIDRPEYMKELARRIVASHMGMLDQLEEQGLLCYNQSYIHCTGAYTDDLPAEGFDPQKPRTKDIWMYGLAQVFSTVSPKMFEEYEVDICMPLFERFGLVYYGCCEPLDIRMEQVRKIPNTRKVSMSPWVDEEKGASEIAGDYVYSRKPNPAMLAGVGFDEAQIRSYLQNTVDVCKRYGCPLELILKDISTVSYEPLRLWKWAEIAMRVVEA